MALAAVWPVEVASEEAVAVALPATLAPVGTTGGAGVPALPQAWTSARPTLPVEALTEVMVIRSEVVVRDGKVTVVAAPALSRAGTATVDPSEKVSVAPVAWSPGLGRSYRTTAFSVAPAAQFSCSQAPA